MKNTGELGLVVGGELVSTYWVQVLNLRGEESEARVSRSAAGLSPFSGNAIPVDKLLL